MTHRIVSCLIALTFVLSSTSPLWAAQPLQAGDGTSRTALVEPPALPASNAVVAPATGQYRVAIAESANSSVEQGMASSSSPVARYSSGFAYDSTASHLVLFGGRGGSGLLNDQWTYDALGWHAVSVAPRPSPRQLEGNSMAYDELRQRLVLFGGFTTIQVGDTWEYDGVYWTQVFPSTSPTARSGASMVYDSARGRVLLFGGWPANSITQNQLWA